MQIRTLLVIAVVVACTVLAVALSASGAYVEGAIFAGLAVGAAIAGFRTPVRSRAFSSDPAAGQRRGGIVLLIVALFCVAAVGSAAFADTWGTVLASILAAVAVVCAAIGIAAVRQAGRAGGRSRT